MKMIKIIFSFTALIVAPLALANFEVPGFELVYTAPVEAELEAKDLRSPVDVWAELFDEAKKEIVLGQMYATNKVGEPLEPVIDSLEKAGKRGVKIRMLLEQKMLSASDPETIEKLKKIPNFRLRILEFNKVKKDGIIHSKYFVVDRKVAYVGSQNFDWRALKHIHELGLKISNKKIVKDVQAIFEQDWLMAERVEKKQKISPLQKKKFLQKKNDAAYLVASPYEFNPNKIPDSEGELVRLLGAAKEELLIQLLDYYPLGRKKELYPIIDNAIRSAQTRGVKVKLLVSHWNTNKPGIDHVKSLAILPGIEIKIVTIPESKEGKIPFARVNHSKFMVVDQKISWIGTSNWTGGYLNNSRNLELIISDAILAKRVAQLHEQLWNSPYAEKIDIQKEYPPVHKGE